MKIAFGCLVNDLFRLQTVLRQSRIANCKVYTGENVKFATLGLNDLLDQIEKDKFDVAVLTHQDMYYGNRWDEKLQEQLKLLPDDWIIAGIVGKNEEGFIRGAFHDMRLPHSIVSDIGNGIPAHCLDECCIIVNTKSGFRFDTELKGFDLYGTLACLQAKEMGGSSWIINCFAEHYCMRSFEWLPDDKFQKSWTWLYKRFEGQKIFSTVLGDEKTLKKALERFPKKEV